MAIRVATIPNPAAGHDWQFVVPGQWLPYLYGVTAVLNTGGTLTTIPDESGNGHDLTIGNNQSHWTFGAAGPFAGGALNYAVTGDGNTTVTNWLAQGAATTAFSTAAMSADFWLLEHNVGLLLGCNVAGVCNVNGTSNTYQVRASQPAAAPTRLVIDTAGTTFTFIGTGGSYDVWQHRAVTNDGVNWKVYTNGVLDDTEPGAVASVGASNRPTLPGGFGNRLLSGSLAGVAFYTSALSGAQVAAHAGAGSTAAAYKTAVLADTPQGLWMLNGTRPGPSRTVDLVVTDGTNKIGEFPAAIAATIAPSFTYSWQVLGSGAAVTADNSTVTVPIPELGILAGYTIGTRTLDLAGTDQWSQIMLWFDDGTGPGGGGPGGGLTDAFTPVILLPSDWQGFP